MLNEYSFDISKYRRLSYLINMHNHGISCWVNTTEPPIFVGCVFVFVYAV